jgi:hypothetical protein
MKNKEKAMYDQQIDRQHPGCIVFLIDQSASMMEPFAGTQESKSTALARAVNDLIRNLVLQCQRGEDIRDYYQLGIIGYGQTIGPAFGGALKGQQLVQISKIADYPLRMATESMPGSPELRIDRPVWVDPVSQGRTPMTAAIDLAGAFLVDWANSHQSSHPPIVLNFSDGEATDGDPRPISAQLRQISTAEGKLLLFNVNLSTSVAAPIEYPNSPAGLPGAYAASLFEMSSPLTPVMMTAAQGLGLPIRQGARGFVYNADSTKLSEFLDVGTRVSLVDR